MEIAIRPAGPGDEPFLWLMLFYASHSDDDPAARPEDVRTDPDLTRYAASWGRPGDLGVIAEHAGEPVGAAWLRLLVEEERDTPAYVDAATPELAVAVLPGNEGRGIGTRMLDELLALAARDYPGVTLTARADNPAIRLYERLGFTTVELITNRVGGQSAKMLLRFD